MKKFTVVIFFILYVICFQTNVNGQIAFNDALKLKSYLVGEHWAADDDKVVTILRKYLEIDETIQSQFRAKNPFTKDFFPSTWTKSAEGPLSSILGSFGNMDVTSLADGFAKFLVKRAKEELSIAYFERLQTFLSNYKDAQFLFPQTYSTLQAIGSEIYNYESFINSLRESFETDLNGLLINLPTVFNNPEDSSFFSKHGELKDVCLSSIYIGSCLLNKENPGQIIANYNPESLLANQTKNVKAAVKVFQVFSESVRSSETGHYWVGMDSLNVLLNDNVAFQIYLGLIWQQISDIRLDDKTYLKDKFENNAETISKVSAYLRGFIAKASIVSANIKNISAKEKDKISFTDYYNFYSSSMDIIQYATNAYQLPGLWIVKPSEDFNKIVIIARAGGYIALDINRKNFSSAIINSYTLYNYAFGGNDNELNSITKNTKKSQAERDYATKLINDRKTINERIENFKKGFLRFGSFIASVSQAQNSDDVEKAIEAAALPSGSSRIKRETPFNVAANAYIGLFAGHENIIGVTDNQLINSYGLAAPIGIAISTGSHSFLCLSPKREGHWSYSAFISLIDIGAVAAFRFQNDQVAQVPTIHLQDIVSPGLFFSIGFPKCPLSFNLGAQMGPNLRQVNVKDQNGNNVNSYQNGVYWRYSASLVVDIPLMNLYTTSK